MGGKALQLFPNWISNLIASPEKSHGGSPPVLTIALRYIMVARLRLFVPAVLKALQIRKDDDDGDGEHFVWTEATLTVRIDNGAVEAQRERLVVSERESHPLFTSVSPGQVTNLDSGSDDLCFGTAITEMANPTQQTVRCPDGHTTVRCPDGHTSSLETNANDGQTTIGGIVGVGSSARGSFDNEWNGFREMSLNSEITTPVNGVGANSRLIGDDESPKNSCDARGGVVSDTRLIIDVVDIPGVREECCFMQRQCHNAAEVCTPSPLTMSSLSLSPHCSSQVHGKHPKYNPDPGAPTINGLPHEHNFSDSVDGEVSIDGGSALSASPEQRSNLVVMFDHNQAQQQERRHIMSNGCSWTLRRVAAMCEVDERAMCKAFKHLTRPLGASEAAINSFSSYRRNNLSFLLTTPRTPNATGSFPSPTRVRPLAPDAATLEEVQARSLEDDSAELHIFAFLQHAISGSKNVSETQLTAMIERCAESLSSPTVRQTLGE